jgi:hypothetical protein
MGKKKNNSKVSSNKNKSSTALSYRCEILQAKNINAHVIIYRNFLTEDEINTLKNLGPTGIKMGHDRDNDLSFEHEVWRFENELEKNAKELYDKVLHVMFLTDEQIWKKIPPVGTASRKKMHPEIEFIQYDADKCRTRGGTPPHIGPHVDNSSAVTFIGMLSQYVNDTSSKNEAKEESKTKFQYNESQVCNNYIKKSSISGKKQKNKANKSNRLYYEGGYNRFEIGDKGRDDPSKCGGISLGRYRELRLMMGDILLFR